MHMFASGHELTVAVVLSALCCAADLLAHLGLFVESRLEMAAQLGWVAGGQAPSTSPRRAWVVPAFVIAPWWRRSPEAYSAGMSPRNFMRSRGVSKRVRAPIAATMVTAPV